MGGQQSTPSIGEAHQPPKVDAGKQAPQVRAWDQQKFDEVIQSQKLSIDQSRVKFFEYHSSVLKGIIEGSYERMNRFRQLLIGRKGVGKTALMKALGVGAKAAGDVIVVYIDYSAPEHARLPFDAAYRCLPTDVQDEYSRLCEPDQESDPVHKFTCLNDALHNCRRTLLFLVDELPLVYGKACSNGISIISELHVIGGLDGRSIHCILSGSGKYVRKLAFCKLDNALKPDYPNYTTVDLNSTRYVPRQILPFCGSAAEFRQAVNAICEELRLRTNFTDSELVTLFERSGGCAGSLRLLLTKADPEPYTTSAKGLAQLEKEKFDFLKNLFLALDIVNSSPSGMSVNSLSSDGPASDKTLPEEPPAPNPNDSASESTHAENPGFDRLEGIFLKMRPISLEILKDQGFINIATIYELVDDGFIHYITNGTDSAQVCFALPSLLHELDIYHGQNRGITLTELVNLKNHFKDGLVCEPTVLRLLAQSSEAVFHTHLTYESTKALPDSLDPDLAIEQVTQRMFTELSDEKDKFGGDGAFLIVDETGSLCLHRIQIKMGVYAIKLAEANNIVMKLNRPGLDKIYATKGFSVARQKHYLVTTRGIFQDARNHLENARVKVIDARELGEKVWPDSVQKLGSVFAG